MFWLEAKTFLVLLEINIIISNSVVPDKLQLDLFNLSVSKFKTRNVAH